MDTEDRLIRLTVTTLDRQHFDFLGLTSSKVEGLREWVLTQAGKDQKESCCECSLLYLGQLLKDDQTLAQCSIAENAFVRATFQKIHVAKPPPSPAELGLRTQGLMASFRACIRLAGASGSSAPQLDELFRALSDSMREVARQCPDLAADRAAFLLVQDGKLHRALLHRPQSISQVLLQHPALLDVLMKALERVAHTLKPNTARNSSETSEGSMSVHYDMNYLMLGDQDDEEDDEEDVMERRARQPPSAPLTRDQLSAALASAAVGSSPAARTANQQISAHELMDAMSFQAAPPASAQPAPASSASGSDPLREKLDALAELGFTDEAAGRRALEAANGDIEMAVDLLLG